MDAKELEILDLRQQYNTYREILLRGGFEAGFPPETDLNTIPEAQLRRMVQHLRDLARTPRE